MTIPKASHYNAIIKWIAKEKYTFMQKKPKVLFSYIESGMGHITSMQAIVDSVTKKYSDEIDIVTDYVMSHSIITKKHETFLTKQVQNTNKFGGFGQFVFGIIEFLGGQGLLRSLYSTIFKSTKEAIFARFKEINPDIIVSTHHAITHIAIEYQRKVDPSCEVITYNPDNNTHVWWDSRQGWFFVNNDFAKREAIKRRKFNPDNIIQVNYTKRQALLDANLSKEEYRQKYDLPVNKFTVIVADGVYALGKCKQFTNKLLKTKKELTIIFIAGKNEKMYNYMIKKGNKLKEKGKTNITLRVYGFMSNIHELYKASDVFITKAGPNSILDSLIMGTPVIVNFCPQPMEEAAYKHFIKKLGCGQAVFKPRKIKKIVESYIDNPSLLDIYSNNISHISNTENGADTIADFIYKLGYEKINKADSQVKEQL